MKFYNNVIYSCIPLILKLGLQHLKFKTETKLLVRAIVCDCVFQTAFVLIDCSVHVSKCIRGVELTM